MTQTIESRIMHVEVVTPIVYEPKTSLIETDQCPMVEIEFQVDDGTQIKVAMEPLEAKRFSIFLTKTASDGIQAEILRERSRKEGKP